MPRIIAGLVALFVGLVLLSGIAVAAVTPVALQLLEQTIDRIETSNIASTDSDGRGDGTGLRFEVDDDLGEVTVYRVLPDASLEPAAQGVAAEVWQLYVRMVGVEVAATSIREYWAGDAPDSDLLAYVVQERNPQYWTLAVNLATADDPQLLIATLIHEYAHVFSFAHTDFDPKAPSCDTIDLFEGCAAADSYLYQFYDTFWRQYGDAIDIENLDPDVAWQFYLDNEDHFVSDYAATNLGEDFAESFMTYVIEDSFDGPNIAAQKLRFFEQFPELVELRTHIRTELASELGLR